MVDSDITAIHTQLQTTLSPIGTPYMYIMAVTEWHGGDRWQFKIVGFVLYIFLYLIYITPITIIPHTIDSQ